MERQASRRPPRPRPRRRPTTTTSRDKQIASNEYLIFWWPRRGRETRRRRRRRGRRQRARDGSHVVFTSGVVPWRPSVRQPPTSGHQSEASSQHSQLKKELTTGVGASSSLRLAMAAGCSSRSSSCSSSCSSTGDVARPSASSASRLAGASRTADARRRGERLPKNTRNRWRRGWRVATTSAGGRSARGEHRCSGECWEVACSRQFGRRSLETRESSARLQHDDDHTTAINDDFKRPSTTCHHLVVVVVLSSSCRATSKSERETRARPRRPHAVCTRTNAISDVLDDDGRRPAATTTSAGGVIAAARLEDAVVEARHVGDVTTRDKSVVRGDERVETRLVCHDSRR